MHLDLSLGQHLQLAPISVSNKLETPSAAKKVKEIVINDVGISMYWVDEKETRHRDAHELHGNGWEFEGLILSNLAVGRYVIVGKCYCIAKVFAYKRVYHRFRKCDIVYIGWLVSKLYMVYTWC